MIAAYAEGLASSRDEGERERARAFAVSLVRMREVARYLAWRRGAAGASAIGSAEAPIAAVGAGSAHPPRIKAMTALEVADKLKVTDSRVRMLCRSGELSATKEGGVWWISQDAVDDYLDGKTA